MTICCDIRGITHFGGLIPTPYFCCNCTRHVSSVHIRLYPGKISLLLVFFFLSSFFFTFLFIIFYFESPAKNKLGKLLSFHWAHQSHLETCKSTFDPWPSVYQVQHRAAELMNSYLPPPFLTMWIGCREVRLMERAGSRIRFSWSPCSLYRARPLIYITKP